jgi:hypothetical protein
VTVTWLHEISQSALAAAVVTLGLVILLELRSIKLLRRSVDSHLGRVFEQLDLLRFEREATPADSALGEPERAALASAAGNAPSSAPVSSSPITGNAYAAAAALVSTGMRPEEVAQRCGLAAGEARLLASLAAARMGRRTDG